MPYQILRSLLAVLLVLVAATPLAAQGWTHPDSDNVTLNFSADEADAVTARNGAQDGAATCTGLGTGATSGTFKCLGIDFDAGYHWVIETVGVRHDVVIKDASGVVVATLQGAGDKASASGPTTDGNGGGGDWGGGWSR